MDAHGDINTEESTLSHNIHGMPLSYLSGMNNTHKYLNCLNLEKDLIYLGIRDL